MTALVPEPLVRPIVVPPPLDPLGIGTTVLPDCRLKDRTKGQMWRDGQWWSPVYCAHCHEFSCWVPAGVSFAFYLCNPCFESVGHLTNCHVVPDDVFFERLRLAQLEEKGRYLTQAEIMAEFKDGTGPLATLLRERHAAIMKGE